MSKKIIYVVLVVALLFPMALSVATAAPLEQETIYTIVLGDNLWTLAEKYLGSGAVYRAIVLATKAKHAEDPTFAKIENVRLIYPGWKLLIPSAEDAEELMALVPRVGLVTDVGKVNDGTFNEFAYKGMIWAAEEYGLQTAFIETLSPTDYEKNIIQFAEERYDVIITVGFMIGDATRKVAPDYPDIKFAGVDQFQPDVIDNVMGMLFSEDESGFLAGALAGQMTQSKTVGIVCGMEIPPVVKFRKGYENGVRSVCPDCTVLGLYIDSFVDPARGKEAALSQIAEGADVIFGAGGPTGSGGILAAAAEGVWVIGVDQDEYLTTFGRGSVAGSDKLLSSAMKRVDVSVYTAIKTALEATFEGGNAFFFAANEGVGLAPFHEAEDDIPQAVKDKLDEIFQGLADGTISTGVEL